MRDFPNGRFESSMAQAQRYQRQSGEAGQDVKEARNEVCDSTTVTCRLSQIIANRGGAAARSKMGGVTCLYVPLRTKHSRNIFNPSA